MAVVSVPVAVDPDFVVVVGVAAVAILVALLVVDVVAAVAYALLVVQAADCLGDGILAPL